MKTLFVRFPLSLFLKIMLVLLVATSCYQTGNSLGAVLFLLGALMGTAIGKQFMQWVDKI